MTHLEVDEGELPRVSYLYRPYSLWVIGLVVFVAAILGVVVAEWALWFGGLPVEVTVVGV